MAEFDYPAQKYFPQNCIECPWLYGLIEDGDLLGSMTEGHYKRVLSERDIDPVDIEKCPGPIDEGDGWESCTSFTLMQLLNK